MSRNLGAWTKVVSGTRQFIWSVVAEKAYGYHQYGSRGSHARGSPVRPSVTSLKNYDPALRQTIPTQGATFPYLVG
jgi:hypothetical protein